ncbi:MAG: hypothetical protein ACAI44_02015 [Candidatus Sericytochromatia bacterium]
MKLILLFAGCQIGAVVFGIAMFSRLNDELQPAVDASESFLTEAARNHVHAAYLQASDAFQKQVSEESLSQYLRKNNLMDIASFSWNFRSIKHEKGQTKGTLHTRDGQEMPVKVLLIYQNESWKVNRLFLGTQELADFKPTQPTRSQP